MAFVLLRASESPLQSSPINSATGPSTQHQRHNMAKEEGHKPRIEILLGSPYFYLKGVGIYVEPICLSGHVALYLNEATPIKEITLQFRGKARLPIPPSESMSINSAPLTYIVCNHDWSFLEGEKTSSHTLKAGRHLFPFRLCIGGSLPSTNSSPVFGGVAVSYKLRAQVVRSGFAFNQTYNVGLPIYLIRSFAPEAMEYQQTLEIEDTWPEKLMYSIMVPHKAWAAGDKVTALVKFVPLTKGVCVLNVTTSIHEHTKVYSPSGAQEQTRIVASLKHEIVDGRAVEVEDSRTGQRRSLNHPPSPASPASPSSGYFTIPPARSSGSTSLRSLGRRYLSHTPIHSSAPSTPPHLPVSEAPVASLSEIADEASTFDPKSNDVVTCLSIDVPLTITPTQSLEPIVVTHGIRWSILILNMDGRTSELRCSLSLHLLDHRLLNESRIHSAATRRLVLGVSEVPQEDEEEIQLPSYTQHVRDRVANMFLPDSTTMPVTNPWISQGARHPPPDAPPTAWPLSRSGRSTPLEAHPLARLPHQPDPNGSNTPLEWVNCELLSSNAPPQLRSQSPPRGESGSDSDPLSRTLSRTSSPERNHHHPPACCGHETYVHGGHTSQKMHNIFSMTMKPFTSFSPRWISRSLSTHHPPTAAECERELESSEAAQRSAHALRIGVPDSSTGTELLHRAFTEVPDYAVASCGFIGGVPPLSSMQGLPSYEENENAEQE